ncbi:hypothetical protein PHYBLDRAFT_140889 [Phycomyces blakesleeanus NRRL 1555(-)]|uniref:Uncharacterized protein n=1 Tax=Phycomyces blakesleeanus (strain ATCC 8743b / DSM 1359 / FGSC 10004 / NBRC 33097 / NRRL 1555) TaxID=763407 RepID=A0A162UYL9_PHYB8|nr:hypothetical protein PHYBLDRAFT_140889 [Phycomyces blakesleeanus NRRL 1555(-)]OAD78833.1 hypothetical protein PHYBLDRAFT_140889 [Phycomyces blakesleeanus NRRL 1555(-)]|eukprot:XP_018296873.1 hypothetical protein PHYBLDRAFT_140889 [Phycomyces blakesleeanus NRRL 1555(-)]
MPTSPVPHIMAHSWTKPPKESTVWYLSPEIGQSARLAQSVERETLNLKVGGYLLSVRVDIGNENRDLQCRS